MKVQDLVLLWFMVCVSGLLLSGNEIAAGLFAIALAYLWSYEA